MAAQTDLFLGIDLSTQSIKATVVDSNAKVIQETLVNFEADLPNYRTQGGAIRGPDGLSVTSPTLMWVEALDLLLDRLLKSNLPFDKIAAISGSGQQHGSVYWKKRARQHLTRLDANKSLLEQFKIHDLLSVQQSPIWMDSSTSEYCEKIEHVMGGAQNVAHITGSRCYERFTGQQIAKIRATQEAAYNDTERISLVSSFLCSIFIGDYAPIDPADGSGMNLMDLHTKDWVPKILETIGEDLKAKLGEIKLAHSVAGKISSYFINKYKFNKECSVITCSGDNPCSLAALKLAVGDLAISLGTSDTLFGTSSDPKPSGEEGHIFCNPIDPDSFMALICYKNGSLTREAVRNFAAESSWTKFNEILQNTPAGNNGHIGFYFQDAEITPRVKAGRHYFDAHDKQIEKFPSNDYYPRAVVESQFLSMWLHCEKLGLKVANRIICTGGASQNKHILQVISDVFGVPVFVGDQANSASLGAAYRALHGWKCEKDNKFVPFTSVIDQPSGYHKATDPNPKAHETYKQMLPRYARLEQQIIEKTRY
jgi:xylulokinase